MGRINDSGVLLNSKIGQRLKESSLEIPFAEKLN